MIARWFLLDVGSSHMSKNVEVRGIPHLAKNERDAPNFLHATLDRIACAPFFKERRMKFAEPNRLHRKSGVWGTRSFLEGRGRMFLLFCGAVSVSNGQ
jgi:hypothetical protein